jgi:hypothetical protein
VAFFKEADVEIEGFAEARRGSSEREGCSVATDLGPTGREPSQKADSAAATAAAAGAVGYGIAPAAGAAAAAGEAVRAVGARAGAIAAATAAAAADYSLAKDADMTTQDQQHYYSLPQEEKGRMQGGSSETTRMAVARHLGLAGGGEVQSGSCSECSVHEVQHLLGYCPQEDLLHDCLTVSA